MTEIYSSTDSDFKASLKKLIVRYQRLITLLLFIGGIVLRIISSGRTGVIWPIIGEVGTFLAAVIAVSYIYDVLVKAEERQVFLSDLDNALDKKLSLLSRNNTEQLKVYEKGRLSIAEKIVFFENAKTEVIEFATAARSFANYFDARPYHEFKLPVVNVLKKGVNFKVLLLDPDSQAALAYSDDLNEPELIPKIRRSMEKLLRLREEFKQAGYAGSFDVFLYPQLPTCYALLVDPQSIEGRIQYSHYLNGLKRADAPIIEVHAQTNQMLFEKYVDYIRRVEASARRRIASKKMLPK